MKILTRAEQGMVIELNHTEFSELFRLVKSVEGKTFDETYSGDFRERPWLVQEVDLTSVFGAVQSFYLAKFKINEIRKLVNILNDALESKEK